MHTARGRAGHSLDTNVVFCKLRMLAEQRAPAGSRTWGAAVGVASSAAEVWCCSHGSR